MNDCTESSQSKPSNKGSAAFDFTSLRPLFHLPKMRTAQTSQSATRRSALARVLLTRSRITPFADVLSDDIQPI